LQKLRPFSFRKSNHNHLPGDKKKISFFLIVEKGRFSISDHMIVKNRVADEGEEFRLG
jgi:hypothetical protein